MSNRRGSAELLQRLYETQDTSNSFKNIQFGWEAFENFNICEAFGMEEVGNQTTGSGMNLNHGQLLMTHVEGACNASSNYVQKAYTTCRFDCILELISTGASLHA